MNNEPAGAGTIRVERVGSVATLWLDNPAKRNAFDQPMLQALTEAATSLARDDSVTAVVLRGAGSRAFGSGADLHAFAASDAAAFAARFGEMDRLLEGAVAALLALPQPLVAAIEGACFGGAVQLAVCADIRIANESMRLAIPAGALGIVYPLDAIERLVALAGPGIAKLILMTGRPPDGRRMPARRHRRAGRRRQRIRQCAQRSVRAARAAIQGRGRRLQARDRRHRRRPGSRRDGSPAARGQCEPRHLAPHRRRHGGAQRAGPLVSGISPLFSDFRNFSS